jgi:mannitol/fructose-specific phosphotransferase system IIA component (Ntr-type)
MARSCASKNPWISTADRHPVDLVFALFAPTDTGVDHLKALALVSRTLRDQALCTKLGPTAIRRRSTPS